MAQLHSTITTTLPAALFGVGSASCADMIRARFDSSTLETNGDGSTGLVSVGLDLNQLNDFQLILIERVDTGVGNFAIVFNRGDILWETGNASNETICMLD